MSDVRDEQYLFVPGSETRLPIHRESLTVNFAPQKLQLKLGPGVARNDIGHRKRDDGYYASGVALAPPFAAHGADRAVHDTVRLCSEQVERGGNHHGTPGGSYQEHRGQRHHIHESHGSRNSHCVGSVWRNGRDGRAASEITSVLCADTSKREMR